MRTLVVVHWSRTASVSAVLTSHVARCENEQYAMIHDLWGEGGYRRPVWGSRRQEECWNDCVEGGVGPAPTHRTPRWWTLLTTDWFILSASFQWVCTQRCTAAQQRWPLRAADSIRDAGVTLGDSKASTIASLGCGVIGWDDMACRWCDVQCQDWALVNVTLIRCHSLHSACIVRYHRLAHPRRVHFFTY